MKHFILFLTLIAILSGCAGPGELVENEGAMLQYQMERSSGKLDTLSYSYLRAIVANRDNGKMRPGLFADYGAALAMQGREEEANQWMNLEMKMFPQSKAYVAKIKSMMVPAYADDTLTCVNLDTLGFAAQQQALEQKAAAKQQKEQTSKKESKKDPKKRDKKSDLQEQDEDEIEETTAEEAAEEIEEEEEAEQLQEAPQKEDAPRWTPRVKVVTSGITREYTPKPKPQTPAKQSSTKPVEDDEDDEEEITEEE